MPTSPSIYYSGPLSPQQMNKDLYSPDGTGYKSTGILFHSHRVILHESLVQSYLLTVSTSGSWSSVPGSGTEGFNILDTGALFGLGCDNPGGNALYQFIPQALATAGIPIQPGSVSPTSSASTAPAFPVGAGGNYLVFHTVTGQTAKTTPAALGAGMFQSPGFGEVFVWQGGMQPHTAGTQGASYFLDLINAGGGCYGTVVSPVAREQLCTTLLPQGNGWVADWAVEILSTASTADINNFSLVLGTATVATSSNPGTVGIYSQTPYTANSTVAAGEYLSVTAAGVTPTSQTTYGAEIYGPGMPTVGNGYTWQPATFIADASASSEQLPASGTDTAGFTPRHTWVWASVSYRGQMVTANSGAYAADGNTAAWSSSGGSIAAVTGTALPGNPLQPQPYGVQLVPSGTVTSATVSSGSFSAASGSVYQATSTAYITTAYTVATGVNWYGTAGTLLSSTTGATTLAAASVWTPVTSWNTAPSRPPRVSRSSGSLLPGTSRPPWELTSAASQCRHPVPPMPQVTWSGRSPPALMNGITGPGAGADVPEQPPGDAGRGRAGHLHREHRGDPGDIPHLAVGVRRGSTPTTPGTPPPGPMSPQ